MVKQLLRLAQGALLQVGGRTRQQPDKNTEPEPRTRQRRPFKFRTRPALFLLLLVAIVLADVLSACGGVSPIQSNNDNNAPYQVSKPVNPSVCQADSSANVAVGPNATCLEANALTCVNNSNCYSCNVTTCTPDPQGLTIRDTVMLPLWEHNSFFVSTPQNLTVNLPVVQAVWGWSLGLANLLAVLLVTISGIRIMLTGSILRRAEAATLIPDIFLGLITSNFSMVIVIIVMSLGNSLSTDLFMWADSALATGDSLVCDAIPSNTSVKTQWFTPDEADFATLTGISATNHPTDSKDTSTGWDHGFPLRWVTQNEAGYKPQAHTAWVTMVQQAAAASITGPPQIHDNNADQQRQQQIQQEVTTLTTAPDGVTPTYPEIQAACHFGGFGGPGGIGNSNVLTAFQSVAETGNGGFWDQLGESFHDMWNSFDNFVQVFFQIMVLGLLGQMVGRFLILDFYIGIAPLALASWALPQNMGQGLAGAWLKGFITTVIMQFVQVLALIVGETTLTAIQGAIVQSMNFSGANGNQLNTFYYIIGTVFIWFIIRVPSLLGSSAVNLVMDMGRQGSSTIGAVINHGVQEGQMVMAAGTLGLNLAAAFS